MAIMPTLTCGSTTSRKACRREAPSVIALISMSQGTASKKPFMTKIANGSSSAAIDQDDAGDRVEQPDPVHQQEDRDDQRHRREGMQDEQALAGSRRGRGKSKRDR